MTNAEKYLKDGVDRQFLTDFSRWYYAITRDIKNVDTILAQFLSEQVQPILTEDERVILRNAKKDYAKIVRDETGAIYFRCDNIGTRGIFSDLFQFIKERRRI